MTHPFSRRLTRLERQLHTRALAGAWPEVHAAAERLRGQAVATLAAALHGQDWPAGFFGDLEKFRALENPTLIQ
jgi:hypothetical protein